MSQGQMPETSVSRMDTNDDHPGEERLISSNGGDSSSHTDSDDGSEIKFKDWGFQVDRLFDVAYRFYKRNESKAFHPSFDERNQLIASILQARYGNFDGGKAPDVGALDLVGRSRRQHWATLKGMSKTEAMSKFIYTLNDLCPTFKAHVEAVKISCDVESTVERSNSVTDQQISSIASIEKDEKLKAIYTSLCRQTYQQFRGYANKQYPNDVQQQKYLISSLQEQYYQQYISQMHPESSPREQLKCSLSPAASETSSIIHENKDNKSTSSVKTDQDLDTSSAIQDNIDLSTNPRLIDNQISTNARKENSLVSVVGNNSSVISPPSETRSQVNPEPKTNGLSAQYAKQTLQPLTHNREVTSDLAKFEPCLPEPNPYQPVDLQSIGKFESFPKPKPIPHNARPLSMPNEVQVITSKDNRRENQPAYTAIDLGEEPATREEPTISPSTLPPQELPPPPPQELPPPPTINHESPAYSPPIDVQQLRSEASPSNDLNSYPSTLDQATCATVIPENKPLWGCDGSSSGGEDSPLEQSISYEPMEPATSWTKRGNNDFKESLVDDKHGGFYVVKQGTLVIIQVPTYPDGRYIHWEFSTEDYDIGFGLDFVYEANLEKPLAIKIFEETDEDEDDDCDEIEEFGPQNGESHDTQAAVSAAESQVSSIVSQRRAEKFARLANTVSIIPTYRRDSHEEIFIGRHRYPGRGYYLLKFDNTYSVLRSKTIFFRVCYFI